MAIPVLICDDSSFARKQMARALPEGWEVEVSFACNGEEAIQAIKEGKGEIVFLDLTMPVLDGFGTLAQIKQQDLNAMVIVVSGDIQPEAHTEVMGLGAMEFIKKPASKEKVLEVLKRFGVI
nr:response regulator [Catenovulum agarivorans]